MSASTDLSGRVGVLGALWRPAGVLYLLFLLSGMALGLWPGAIFPSRDGLAPAALPVLRTVAIAQIAFMLLVYPLVVLRRSEKCDVGVGGARLALESVVYAVIAVPFYAVSAYLADAVARDVIRVMIYVLCVWSLGLSGGLWLAGRPRDRAAVLVMLVAVALGLPAGCYIVREFLTAAGPMWLWRLTPAVFVWELAQQRGESYLPAPAWAALLWPAVAAAGALTLIVLPGQRVK